MAKKNKKVRQSRAKEVPVTQPVEPVEQPKPQEPVAVPVHVVRYGNVTATMFVSSDQADRSIGVQLSRLKDNQGIWSLADIASLRPLADEIARISLGHQSFRLQRQEQGPLPQQ